MLDLSLNAKRFKTSTLSICRCYEFMYYSAFLALELEKKHQKNKHG